MAEVASICSEKLYPAVNDKAEEEIMNNTTKENQQLYVYRLTGYFPLIVITALICCSAAVILRFSPPPNTEPITSKLGFWMTLAGFTPTQQAELLQDTCWFIGVALISWSLIAPWLTKTLVLTATLLEIQNPVFRKMAPIVLPLSELRRSRLELMSAWKVGPRWWRQCVFLRCGIAEYAFPAVQFRSRLEFEKFCAQVKAE
jgi:hypothetical protein